MLKRLSLALLFSVLVTTFGCEKVPPKTTDPAEVEKISESLKRDAQRERENK